jgi:FixJ family two-component response regulator
VLLTDVQLPFMDGAELAGMIRATRPGLKVIFISGYSREEAFSHSTDDGAGEFLQKPFTPIQLAEALGRVLIPSPVTPNDTPVLPKPP